MTGQEISLVEVKGLSERLRKFADLEQGNGKFYYTHIPDLENSLELKLTAKILVRYNPQTKVLAVTWKLPEKKCATLFLVDSSDKIIRYNDSVDPSAYHDGTEIDGTIAYITEQTAPKNIHEYIKADIGRIVGQLEKCGSPATSRRKPGQDFKSR